MALAEIVEIAVAVVGAEDFVHTAAAVVVVVVIVAMAEMRRILERQLPAVAAHKMILPYSAAAAAVVVIVAITEKQTNLLTRTVTIGQNTMIVAAFQEIAAAEVVEPRHHLP